MILTDKWFSAPAENEKGQLVMVTGRDAVDNFRNTKKLNERIEVKWTFVGQSNGMPTLEQAEQMEKVEETLRKAMEKDKLAILTSIYTGGGEKTWVFYARTSRIFGERLNDALAEFEQLPLQLYVEIDEAWEEYLDMYEMKGWNEEEE